MKPKSTARVWDPEKLTGQYEKSPPAERQTLLLSQETEVWMAKEGRFLSSGQGPSNTSSETGYHERDIGAARTLFLQQGILEPTLCGRKQDIWGWGISTYLTLGL